LPNIRLHGLRHNHATLLLAAGADVKTVSATAVARLVGLD
jgi:site-specific recombinase XerD